MLFLQRFDGINSFLPLPVVAVKKLKSFLIFDPLQVMPCASSASWRKSLGPQCALELSRNWPYRASFLILSGSRWTLAPVNVPF